MQFYNYTSAYKHAKSAFFLLVDDSWTKYIMISLPRFTSCFQKFVIQQTRQSHCHITRMMCVMALINLSLCTNRRHWRRSWNTCRFIEHQAGCIWPWTFYPLKLLLFEWNGPVVSYDHRCSKIIGRKYITWRCCCRMHQQPWLLSKRMLWTSDWQSVTSNAWDKHQESLCHHASLLHTSLLTFYS